MVARNQYRVVGFIVQPSSRDVSSNTISNPICDTDRTFAVSETGPTEVVYTYTVEWRVLSFPSLSYLSNRVRDGRRDGINISTL